MSEVKQAAIIGGGVIGGGWAGLAAAVTLAANDIPVTLIESAKQLGGRARCAPFGKETVDNGQHLLIGAYEHTLSLLQQIGVDTDQTLVREHLSLERRPRPERRLEQSGGGSRGAGSRVAVGHVPDHLPPVGRTGDVRS